MSSNKMKELLRRYKLNTAEMIYAAAFAVMTVLSRHTVYSDEVASSILTVRVGALQAVDFLIFIVVTALAYLCLESVKYLLKKLYPYVSKKENSVSGKSLILIWLICFAVIMICYIPYMMSYWPGGIYNDTCDSIDIALGRSALSDQNTVLYALIWRLCFAIGSVFDQGDYGGLKLMTVMQPAAIASVAASFFVWLKRKGARAWVIVMLTAVISLFPIFPYYGISLWKETWFGLEFFIYTWLWNVIAEKYGISHRDDDHDGGKTSDGAHTDLKLTAVYIMSTIFVIFGRNNGIYLVLFVMIISAMILHKSMPVIKWNRLLLVNIILIVAAVIIRGPVYRAAGIKTSSPAESLGIPLQQTAYMISKSAVSGMADADVDISSVVSDSLRLSDSQYEVITSIMPVDAWVNLYNPVVVDSIKFGEFFNKEYFDENTGDFLKTYAGMVIKNPKLAIQGYLISTMGFWDAYKSSSSAYICTAHTSQAEYFMSDYFNMKTDKVLSDIVGPRWYISAGALVWIMLGLAVICISHERHSSLNGGGEETELAGSGLSVLVFLPGIALWLTYMLATPLSFSFRYVFGLLLCIPVFLMAAMKDRSI